MKLSEKVSYLKGLMDGLEIDKTTKEGKVIDLMADILQDIAADFENVQDQLDEMVDAVDAIDEDLGSVEEDLYGDDEDDNCDNCDCCDCDDDDCDCGDDDDYYEVCCPSCNNTICLDEGMISEGSMTCPNCGEHLEFDFSDDVEADGADKE